MDPSAFSGLLSQLDREPFSKDKIKVLKSYKHCMYSGVQLTAILAKFPHSSDKDDVVEEVARQLTTISGQDAKNLISGIAFGNDQLKVIKHIACRIDPATKYVVLDAITFPNDRSKAREYLDAAVFVGGYGAYPPPQPAYPPQQPGVYPPQQPGAFPGAYPPQQPGVFPGAYPPQQPGAFPGAYPPQQPGAFPGAYPPQQPGVFPGTYPPQQPGAYPPQQQGAYPPQQPGASFQLNISGFPQPPSWGFP